jgi:voltage-gated potassium channel
MTGSQFLELPKKARRRLVVRSLMRVFWINVLLFGLYCVLPLRRISGFGTLVLFVGGLVVFAVAVLRQVQSIAAADYPRLRAIVGIGTAVPLLIVVFSAVYTAMSFHHPAIFSESLNRLDSLYFTITVLATVGFGDIVPKTDLTRLVVTLQMVFDLALVGVVVKALSSAVGRSDARPRNGSQEEPTSP